jgi:hypothetical protein
MRIETLNITKTQLESINTNPKKYGIAQKRTLKGLNSGDVAEVIFRHHLKNKGAKVDLRVNRDGKKWNTSPDVLGYNVKSSHATLVSDFTKKLTLDEACNYYLENDKGDRYAYIENGKAYIMNKSEMAKFIMKFGSVQKNNSKFKLRLKVSKKIPSFLESL